MRSLLILTTTLGGTLAPVAPTFAQENPEVTWQYSLWGQPRAATKYLEPLPEWIAERTDGQFRIELHWGDLSQPNANLDGISVGAFEGATFCADYTPGKLPSITGISLPFLPWKGNHHIQRVIDAYMATEEPTRELANFDAMYYMTATVPAYEIVGTGDAPASLEDLSGMKLRMVGGLADVLSSAGAIPVEVPSSETYTSMSQNLVDGAVLPYYAILSYRAYEPGDWYTNGLQLGTISCGSVFRRSAYEALPQAYKDLLEEYKEIGYANVRPILAETDEKLAPETFAEDGLLEVVIPDADRQAFVDQYAQPVWDEWIAQMDDRGYDGQALLDRMLTIMDEQEARLREEGML
jgi:TRAP-type C4-dicarboxylate transport system substrate-binding protein